MATTAVAENVIIVDSLTVVVLPPLSSFNMNPLLRREFAMNSIAALYPLVASSLLSSQMIVPAFGQTQTRIRVGQIGTKHGHAAGKLEAVKKLGELFELIGVVEQDQAQRERIQETGAFANCPWMPFN